jgi:hypothetical protein
VFNIELLTTDREQYPAMPYGNLGQESPAAALNEIARDSFIALERTTQVIITVYPMLVPLRISYYTATAAIGSVCDKLCHQHDYLTDNLISKSIRLLLLTNAYGGGNSITTTLPN